MTATMFVYDKTTGRMVHVYSKPEWKKEYDAWGFVTEDVSMGARWINCNACVGERVETQEDIFIDRIKRAVEKGRETNDNYVALVKEIMNECERRFVRK